MLGQLCEPPLIALCLDRPLSQGLEPPYDEVSLEQLMTELLQPQLKMACRETVWVFGFAHGLS